MNKQQIKTKIAIRFSAVLKEWLTADEMKELIILNKSELDPSICSSHEFCDANEAMNEAFTAVMKRDLIFFDELIPATEKQNSADMELLNGAWAIAKANNFYYTTDFNDWENEITELIESMLEISRSDAQGFVEVNEFYIMQSWSKGLTAKETAILIDVKSRQALQPLLKIK
jgi:hypothetical protein